MDRAPVVGSDMSVLGRRRSQYPAVLSLDPAATKVGDLSEAEPVRAVLSNAFGLGGFDVSLQRTDGQRQAIALAQKLAAELRDADGAILALPLYNWGVSQHVKIWIDLVMAGGAHSERLLDGKPTILVTSRGGGYGPGTPREGWDHNTGFLRHVIADVWGADLTVVEQELTLAAVTPAMAGLLETAENLHRAAHEAAAQAGRKLAA
jgi:FMN-dependent NADH-azoreductase